MLFKYNYRLYSFSWNIEILCVNFYMSIKEGEWTRMIMNLDLEEYCYECTLKFGTKDFLGGNDNYAPYVFVGFFFFFGSEIKISDL